MIASSIAKTHKLRKVVSIVTLVSGLATGALTIVAFTGRVKGNFTINLKQEGIRLAMDTNPDLINPTTFIKIDDYPQFTLDTYEHIVNTHGDQIDNPATNDKGIGTVGEDFTTFFKHTFYIKNLGTSVANFAFSVNITDMSKPSNAKYGYDSLLRIMVYENDGLDPTAHENEVYAKAAEYKDISEAPLDENGKPELREPIALKSVGGKIENVRGYASPFLTTTKICERTNLAFLPGQVIRYTVVAWLEGSDPQATGDSFKGGHIQLGVNINGEQKE